AGPAARAAAEVAGAGNNDPPHLAPPTGAHLREPLEVLLARRAGDEQQEHRGRLRSVLEGVQAADRHVEEVARPRREPALAVVEAHSPGDDEERLRDGLVEMGARPR